MMTVVPPHPANRDRLAEVVAEMLVLGAPTIRAVWDGRKYLALEGSHRIAAAHQLGLTPEIIEVEEDEEMEHDFDDLDSNRVGDLLEYIVTGPAHGFHEFDFD